MDCLCHFVFRVAGTQGAGALGRYVSPLVSTAHAIRASLLASATGTSLNGFFASRS
jgi:hypothetical protein